MIKLGEIATDNLSGFTGVVTGRTEYLYGCIQVRLTPQGLNRDGQPADAQWFDELQVVRSESKTIKGFSPAPSNELGIDGPPNA